MIAYSMIFRTSLWAILTLLGVFLIAFAYLFFRRPPGQKRRFKLSTSILFLVSIILSIALAEIGARLAIPELSAGGAMIYKAHPEYIHTLIPGASGEQAITGDDGTLKSYHVTISQQGLRDREYAAKSGNEYRILMLGDSFTMGNGLSIGDTIPKRLESLLRTENPHNKISVINAGCGGYGPWQEHGFLLERGFRLEPDLVILQILPDNDIGDTLIRRGKTPRAYEFLNTHYRILLMNYHKDWKAKFDFDLQNKSRLYRKVCIASGGRVSIANMLNRTRFLHNPDIVQFPPSEDRAWWIELTLRDWYPELVEGWQMFEEDVLSIQSDCHDRGIDFLAFVVPSGAGLIQSSWEYSINLGGNAEPRERGKELRLAQEFLQRQHIPYIPVGDAIADHAEPEKLYYLNDGHFTPLGAKLAANKIAEYLSEHDVIKWPGTKP